MTTTLTERARAEGRTRSSPRRLGADWIRLFSAGAVSMVGDGMMIAVLPLFAATLTSEPSEIAAVATCAGLPWLLLSLPAGSLADRWDRRRLMIAAQTAQMVIIATVALLALTDQARIWALCVAAFAMVTAETVFRSAGEAVVPAVVDRRHLVTANGRQQASIFIGEQSVGPPLGAALFAVAACLPFVLNAATFGISILLIAAIRPSPAFRPRIARQSALRDVADGMRFLRRHVVIRTLTGLAAVANFTTFMVLSTMVLFAAEITSLDERGYGLLLGAGAIGGAIGAIVSTTVVKRAGLRSTLLVVPFVTPIAFLLVGLFGRDPILLAAMLTVASFALALWNVVSFTLRQLLVPSEMLGRVGGAAKMIAFGAGPLGALTGGLVAQQWGLIAPWVVAGLLRLAMALVMVSALRRQRITHQDGTTGPRRGRHRRPGRTPGQHSRHKVDQRPCPVEQVVDHRQTIDPPHSTGRSGSGAGDLRR